jgi:hypothetical protein
VDLQPNGHGVLLPMQLNVQPAKSPRKTKPVSEPVKIQREMKAISAKLRKDAIFLKRYFSTSIIAEDLAEAIERLTRLLVGLAEKDAMALWGSRVRASQAPPFSKAVLPHEKTL